jgi:thiol-disulfide isomerase/thioredoxin
MKINSIIVIALLISFKSMGGIVFQNLTIAQAKELALKEGKMVFVDFFSDQCPPCKIMETTVFIDKDLGVLMAENYIAVRSQSGNIEGKKENSKYRIKMLPTMMFLDPSTSEYYKLEGKKSLDTLMFYSLKLKTGIAKNPETSESSGINSKSDFPEKDPYKKDELPSLFVFRNVND